MATIAPWIVPPNFLGAMEAGSAAGTRQRAQAASETEAADRLRFAYDSLNRKEEQAAQLAAQKHELAKAAMELRGQQMQGLQDYREGQLSQREAALKQQADLASQSIQQRGNIAAQSLAERTAHNVSMEEARDAVKSGQATIVEHAEFPGVKFLRNPSGAEVRISPSERSPTVSLDETGKPKGFSGQLSNPTMQALMGTNAPSALNVPGTAAPPPDNLFPRAAPNLLVPGGAGALLPGGLSPMPLSPPKRVKVVGPDGKKGTIEEGDDLPGGWKLVE